MSSDSLWEHVKAQEQLSDAHIHEGDILASYIDYGGRLERGVLVAWLQDRKHPYDHQQVDAIERAAHLRGE